MPRKLQRATNMKAHAWYILECFDLEEILVLTHQAYFMLLKCEKMLDVTFAVFFRSTIMCYNRLFLSKSIVIVFSIYPNAHSVFQIAIFQWLSVEEHYHVHNYMIFDFTNRR